MKRLVGLWAMGSAGLAAGPAAADPANPWCCGAKVAVTFGEAAVEIRILTALLFAVGLAALVLWVLALGRLRRGDWPARTLAFLAAWRTGSLPLAAAGIAYLAMNFFVAVYAYPPAQSYRTYAPGWAEMAMVLWAGLTASAACALAHAHLTARTTAA